MSVVIILEACDVVFVCVSRCLEVLNVSFGWK